MAKRFVILVIGFACLAFGIWTGIQGEDASAYIAGWCIICAIGAASEPVKPPKPPAQ